MNEFTGDKRSKAYKVWKVNHAKESEGLGDTIDKIATATGIKKAVKFLAGDDCGCDERQDALNKEFKYNKPECLTEAEYNYLSDYIKPNRTKVDHADQVKMIQINNRVFHKKLAPSRCVGCVKRIYSELERLLKTYK